MSRRLDHAAWPCLARNRPCPGVGYSGRASGWHHLVFIIAFLLDTRSPEWLIHAGYPVGFLGGCRWWCDRTNIRYRGVYEGRIEEIGKLACLFFHPMTGITYCYIQMKVYGRAPILPHTFPHILHLSSHSASTIVKTDLRGAEKKKRNKWLFWTRWGV